MFSLPEDVNEDIKILYEYWSKISPVGRLPGRQHFDPLDVPTLLPNLWLIEVHREPMRFYYRLVGSRIEEHAGESLTGLWFAQSLEGENLRRAQENLELVVRSKEAHWRRGKPFIRLERDYVELERIYLPLAEDGEVVNMVLAMTKFTKFPYDKIPRWDSRTHPNHPVLAGRDRRIARKKPSKQTTSRAKHHASA